MQPDTGEKVGLGVVIIHYGRAEPTRQCLQSVIEDPSTVERHIAVVDNFGNLDPEEFEDSATLVQRPDNPGFGGGANAGVAELKTKADFLGFVVMNNDLMIDPGFLDAAAEALEPMDVGAVGGPILVGLDQPKLWYAGGTIRPLTGTVRQSHSKADAGRRREVGFVPGTAIAVRADAWFEIDGFDAGYFLYNEDIDLCLRLRRSGKRLLFEPGMACLHDLGETTGSSRRSALYLEQITRTRLRPFRPRAYQLYLGAVHTLYNIARILRLFLRH
ncbi:MAG: glycosyltransferase family 2 protein, partial [Acidobacteriota bacterium]